jgi:hypothetical protein
MCVQGGKFCPFVQPSCALDTGLDYGFVMGIDTGHAGTAKWSFTRMEIRHREGRNRESKYATVAGDALDLRVCLVRETSTRQ